MPASDKNKDASSRWFRPAALAALVIAVCLVLFLRGRDSVKREGELASEASVERRTQVDLASSRVSVAHERQAQQRLPAFLEPSGSSPQKFVTTPGAPGYEPGRLAILKGGLKGVFSEESRNEAWAKPLENAIPTLAGKDVQRLVPGMEVKAVECRTTVCRVEWEVPKELQSRAAAVARYLLPSALSDHNSSQPKVMYMALFGCAPVFDQITAGDATSTLDAMKKLRKIRFDEFRSGKSGYPIPSGIPPEAWPAD